MKDKNEISKITAIVIRYAIIQLAFWAACKFAINGHSQEILWIIGIPLFGAAMLTALIPYFAAKSVQRRTLLGYECSRNGILTLHVGLGSLLALTLFDIVHFVIPCILIVLGGTIVVKRLKRHKASAGRLVS